MVSELELEDTSSNLDEAVNVSLGDPGIAELAELADDCPAAPEAQGASILGASLDLDQDLDVSKFAQDFVSSESRTQPHKVELSPFLKDFFALFAFAIYLAVDAKEFANGIVL